MDESIKTIQAKDGEPITIRPFSLRDLGRLNRMSHLTSSATRNNYRAPLAQPRPPLDQKKQLATWMLVEIKLALSGVRAFRGLLALFPRLTYMAFVAANSRNELIGFRFYNIIGMKTKNKYIVEEGVVLRDDYQNKGIGTIFNALTLEMMSKHVYVVISEIYGWNARQLHVVETVGYEEIGTSKNASGEIIKVFTWRHKSAS